MGDHFSGNGSFPSAIELRHVTVTEEVGRGVRAFASDEKSGAGAAVDFNARGLVERLRSSLGQVRGVGLWDPCTRGGQGYPSL
jgi:hypothetical protein